MKKIIFSLALIALFGAFNPVNAKTLLFGNDLLYAYPNEELTLDQLAAVMHHGGMVTVLDLATDEVVKTEYDSLYYDFPNKKFLYLLIKGNLNLEFLFEEDDGKVIERNGLGIKYLDGTTLVLYTDKYVFSFVPDAALCLLNKDKE
ncbi:MAG: hypothetical protein Q9M37_06605 [Desulfonauticus sp.]|nr:hypothetical protein [Desulfonauticus sp.]